MYYPTIFARLFCLICTAVLNIKNLITENQNPVTASFYIYLKIPKCNLKSDSLIFISKKGKIQIGG